MTRIARVSLLGVQPRFELTTPGLSRLIELGLNQLGLLFQNVIQQPQPRELGASITKLGAGLVIEFHGQRCLRVEHHDGFG